MRDITRRPTGMAVAALLATDNHDLAQPRHTGHELRRAVTRLDVRVQHLRER